MSPELQSTIERLKKELTIIKADDMDPPGFHTFMGDVNDILKGLEDTDAALIKQRQLTKDWQQDFLEYGQHGVSCQHPHRPCDCHFEMLQKAARESTTTETP